MKPLLPYGLLIVMRVTSYNQTLFINLLKRLYYSPHNLPHKFRYLSLLCIYIIKNLISMYVTSYTQRTPRTLRCEHVKIGVTKASHFAPIVGNCWRSRLHYPPTPSYIVEPVGFTPK